MYVSIVGLIFLTVLNFSDQNVVQLQKRQTTSTCTCGLARNGRRVVGGVETPVDVYPWMAALIIKNGSAAYQFCGGSLINENHVLTAAHCFPPYANIKMEQIFISLGDHDLASTKETPNVVRSVAAMFIHPKYSNVTKQNDIAILKLNASVTFTEYVRPVCMPSPTFDCTGKTVAAAGWGLTTEGGSGTTKLRDVQVPVVPMNQCNATYSGRLTNDMMCAGATSKDTCQGDSGGPLLYKCDTRHMQVGITSNGIGCGQYPGVYTKVAAFLSFTNSVIAPYTTCTISCP